MQLPQQQWEGARDQLRVAYPPDLKNLSHRFGVSLGSPDSEVTSPFRDLPSPHSKSSCLHELLPKRKDPQVALTPPLESPISSEDILLPESQGPAAPHTTAQGATLVPSDSTGFQSAGSCVRPFAHPAQRHDWQGGREEGAPPPRAPPVASGIRAAAADPPAINNGDGSGVRVPGHGRLRASPPARLGGSWAGRGTRRRRGGREVGAGGHGDRKGMGRGARGTGR